MEKKHLIRFLREGKKGSYNVLVQAYHELISSMPIVMAMEIIQEDLQKESEERIELNYFSWPGPLPDSKKRIRTRLNPNNFSSKMHTRWMMFN